MPAIDELRLLGLGGSNKVMAGELARIVKRALPTEESRRLLHSTKLGPGALAYPFDPALAALAVTYHRTSARVLWTLYESTHDRLEPLYDDLEAAIASDRRPWLREGARFSVLAFAPRSVAAGERQVVGVVKNALLDAARRRGVELSVDPEHPELVFHVRSRVDGDGVGHVNVSLDLAGRPMHQRGYRTESGAAPLREDLAANLVMLARHDSRRECVVDPMAGSGTLCIEAALLGAGRPVWMSGRVPLARSVEPLAAELREKRPALFGDTQARLFAAERDAETAAALRTNLQTAGLQAEVHEGDFRTWQPAVPDGPGLIVSNPPYGERLAESPADLLDLYRDLGRWCTRYRGWRAAFLMGDEDGWADQFARAFGRRPRVEKPMRNGPLFARFLMFDL